MHEVSGKRYVFPPWTNYLLPAALVVILGGGLYLVFLFVLASSPQTKDVGYAPDQPMPFSHAVHVGHLQMDCRYCHSTVERAPFAALPASETCMNCHANILPDSPSLQPLRESYETGTPISWIKVHDLPDHAYFDHAAHVAAGIGCYTCHGPVDEMDVVYQHQPLTMAWCLECHRDPERYVRPRQEVFNMQWHDSMVAAALQDSASQVQDVNCQHAAAHSQAEQASCEDLLGQSGISSRFKMESCSTCHR